MADAVRTSIHIPASPQEVWDVVMDPRRFGDWVTIHRRVGEVTHDPLEVGAEIEQTLCLRGASFKVRWTVVEYEAPYHAVMEGKGPARSRARAIDDLADEDGGTRFDYTNEFHPPFGPLGAAANRVLVGGVSEREAQASLRKLKALFEG